MKKQEIKIINFNTGFINEEKFLEILQGWQAYASWANTHRLRDRVIKLIQPKN